MTDLNIALMQEKQLHINKLFKAKFGALSPENAPQKLLWAFVELGEATDILKKNNINSVVNDKTIREHYIEELSDVFMYLTDAMLCFNISPNEFQSVYTKKFNSNVARWSSENDF